MELKLQIHHQYYFTSQQHNIQTRHTVHWTMVTILIIATITVLTIIKYALMSNGENHLCNVPE